jgi:small ligand-binding sensory domain FIST
MTERLQWINALSTRPSLETAIAEVVEKVEQNMSGTPDLGIFFISSAYATDFTRVMPLLLEKLTIPVLIGCSGGGIVGTGDRNQTVEIEGNPALSLTVAKLPDVEIHPFQLWGDELPDLDSSPEAWIELIGVSPQKNPQFILLADPFTAKINDLLEGLDFAYPSSAKIGGLASTGTIGGQSALFIAILTVALLFTAKALLV